MRRIGRHKGCQIQQKVPLQRLILLHNSHFNANITGCKYNKKGAHNQKHEDIFKWRAATLFPFSLSFFYTKFFILSGCMHSLCQLSWSNTAIRRYFTYHRKIICFQVSCQKEISNKWEEKWIPTLPDLFFQSNEDFPLEIYGVELGT